MDSKFLVGLGLSAVSFFLRYAIKDMPRPVAWLGVLIGVLIMATSATPATAKFVNGPLIMLAVGIFCVVGSGLWYWFGDFTAPAQAEGTQLAQNDKGGGVNQNNQTGPNFNVPGNNNQFNLYNRPPEPTSDTMVYQGGIVVGKAFGARRLPNDATHFQFAEITNCAQFNTGAPFTYGGIRMIFEKEENSAYMVAGRPDSPIRYGVLARVLE